MLEHGSHGRTYGRVPAYLLDVEEVLANVWAEAAVGPGENVVSPTANLAIAREGLGAGLPHLGMLRLACPAGTDVKAVRAGHGRGHGARPTWLEAGASLGCGVRP